MVSFTTESVLESFSFLQEQLQLQQYLRLKVIHIEFGLFGTFFIRKNLNNSDFMSHYVKCVQQKYFLHI